MVQMKEMTLQSFIGKAKEKLSETAEQILISWSEELAPL